MRMIIEHIPPSSYKPKITVEYLPIPQLDDRFSSFAAAGGKQRKRARQIKRARRMVSTIDEINRVLDEAGRRYVETFAESLTRWAETGEP